MANAPNSLRARYGDPTNDMVNALHGSASPEASEREIELIFPHILHGDSDNEGNEANSQNFCTNF